MNSTRAKKGTRIVTNKSPPGTPVKIAINKKYQAVKRVQRPPIITPGKLTAELKMFARLLITQPEYSGSVGKAVEHCSL